MGEVSVVINVKDMEQAIVTLEDNKVVGGSCISSEGKSSKLVVKRKYELCDYPFIELGVE